MTMTKIAGVLSALWFAAATIARADAPTVASVEPSQVFTDEATTVTIRGQGFTADTRVGLLDAGGPRVVARHRFWETGGVADVAIQGDTAYVASSAGLVILDAADPARLREIGRIAIRGGHVRSEGVRAFVVEYGALRIVDVSDPAAPWLLSTIPLGNSEPFVDVALGHGFLFLSERRGDVLVVDVRDPGSPRLVRRMRSWETGFIYDPRLALVGDHLLIAGISSPQGVMVRVFDVTTPENPVLARNVVIDESWLTPTDLLVADGRAYLGLERSNNGYTRRIRILDVREPSEPEHIGVIEGISGRLAIQGSELIVSGARQYEWEPLTAVFDVRNPAAPTEIASIYGYYNVLGSKSGYVLAAASNEGLVVIDFRADRRRMAAPLGTFRPGSPVLDVRVARSGAVASFGGAGLQLVDIGDASRPRVIGTYEPPARGGSLIKRVLSEDLLAAMYCDGLWEIGSCWLDVVDFRDPEIPRLAGTLPWVSSETDLFTSEGRLHVNVGDRTIVTFDLNRPAPEALSWRFPETIEVWDQWAADRQAIYANGYESGVGYRVFVLDANDPGGDPYGSEPLPEVSVIARIEPPFSPHEIVATDGLLFLMGDGGARAVFDVRNPSSPRPIPDPIASWLSPRLVAEDGRVARTNDRGIVELFDVRDLLHPWLSGSLPQPTRQSMQRTIPAAIVGGNVLVPNAAGFALFPLPPKLDPPAAATPTQAAFDVPASFPPGVYHLRATNGEPEGAVLEDALRVCTRRPFEADLAPLPPALPAAGLTPLTRPFEPIRWRLALSGDPSFFGEPPLHESILALPALPAGLTTRFVQGDGSGRTIVELKLAPELGLGEVVLTADDRTAVEALWSGIRESAGIALPRLDERHYGDVVLEVHGGDGSGSPTTTAGTTTSRPSANVRPAPAQRYRYEFVGGRLDATRAWGKGVDLSFRAVAKDVDRCEFVASVGFVETLLALCEELDAGQSSLALMCGN